jgi:hypothetical protein
VALLSLGWRRLMPGSGRFAARIGRLIVAGALACGTVLAMTAPAFGQPPAWSVVPSPNGTGSLLNQLVGVSCVSATACTAVGLHGDSSGAAKTLIESWNGTSWSVVPAPAPGQAELNGVSCVSATACTAVGSYDASDNVVRTLAESWNGTNWSVIPTPTKGVGVELDGVSCVSATACTAVGTFDRSGDVIKTLAESWNGTSWSVVPTRNPPPVNGSSWLTGVSCVSATACTAVGYREKSLNVQMRTLVESWNGTSWSVVQSPNAGRATTGNLLSGVSCVSATACTAVGAYANSGTGKTLVESWDGTSWSVVPSPNAGLPRTLNVLNGVSCVSPTACTAAGLQHSSGSPEMTLIESSS